MGRASATKRVRYVVTPGGGTRRVDVTPRPDQSEDSIQNDLHIHDEHAAKMAAQGTQLYKQHFRWVGPIKFLCSKEVGPPPWKYPRIDGALDVKHPYLQLRIGWRSTAYMAAFMWQRKSKAS